MSDSNGEVALEKYWRGWEQLPQFLSESGVEWWALEFPMQFDIESDWRSIYSQAFEKSLRMRSGFKAEFDFSQENCNHYLIVPFTSDVPRTPMNVRGRGKRVIQGFECQGPLVPLGQFSNAEFFVAPSDFSWTMVHTHEDHEIGGPYFIRREWIA
jgi:hypothetical protein